MKPPRDLFLSCQSPDSSLNTDLVGALISVGPLTLLTIQPALVHMSYYWCPAASSYHSTLWGGGLIENVSKIGDPLNPLLAGFSCFFVINIIDLSTGEVLAVCKVWRNLGQMNLLVCNELVTHKLTF